MRRFAPVLALLVLVLASGVRGQYAISLQSTVNNLATSTGDKVGDCVGLIGSRFAYVTAPNRADPAAGDERTGLAFARELQNSGATSQAISHSGALNDNFGTSCRTSTSGWAWACSSQWDLGSGRCWYTDFGLSTTTIPSAPGGSLVAPDEELVAEFGYSVFVSDDGEWTAIGAPGSDGPNAEVFTELGAVHLLHREGGEWVQTFYANGGNQRDRLGESVSVWSYPDSAVADSSDLRKRPRVLAAASREGKYINVWINEDSDPSKWELRGTIGGAGQGEGWGSSIVAVEDMVYVGDPSNVGQVLVYRWKRNEFAEPIVVLPTDPVDGENTGFGSSISVGDSVAGGRFFAVGARFGSYDGCVQCGFVTVYTLDGDEATSLGTITAEELDSSDFGQSVDMHVDLDNFSDGKYRGYLLVGYPGYSETYNLGGAYQVFEMEVPTAFAGALTSPWLATALILGVGLFGGLVVGTFWIKKRNDVAAVVAAESPSNSISVEKPEFHEDRRGLTYAEDPGDPKRKSQGGQSDATSIPESFGTVADDFKSDATAFSQATDATRPGPASMDIGHGLPRKKSKATSGKRKGSGNSRGSRRKGSGNSRGSKRKGSGSRRAAPTEDATAQGTYGKANTADDVTAVPVRKFIELNVDEQSVDLKSVASLQAPNLPDMVSINDMSIISEPTEDVSLMMPPPRSKR